LEDFSLILGFKDLFEIFLRLLKVTRFMKLIYELRLDFMGFFCDWWWDFFWNSWDYF